MTNAELNHQLEIAVQKKIDERNMELEEKQSSFYNRIRKSADRCQELMSSIETKGSDVERRSSEKLATLESEFACKTQEMMESLQDRLNEKRAQAEGIAACLGTKIKDAKETCGTIDRKMSEAQCEVEQLMKELQGEVSHAEQAYNNLKKGAKYAEKCADSLRTEAAKGLASISEASSTIVSKVTDPVLQLVKNSLQGVVFDGNEVAAQVTTSTKMISPPSKRTLVDSTNVKHGIIPNEVHATKSKKSGSKTRSKARAEPSGTVSGRKRSTKPSEPISTKAGTPPRKKTRHASSPNPTIASYVTPPTNPPVVDSQLKLTRNKRFGKSRKRDAVQQKFNFGWN